MHSPGGCGFSNVSCTLSHVILRIVVTSETGEQLSVEKSGSEKEVTGLDPNTLYHVAVMLTFIGGGLGPIVERHIATLEDGM